MDNSWWIVLLLIAMPMGLILQYFSVRVVQQLEHQWLEESLDFLSLQDAQASYESRLSYPQESPRLLNNWPFSSGNVFYCAWCAWLMAALYFIASSLLFARYSHSLAGYSLLLLFLPLSLLASRIDAQHQLLPDQIVYLLLWGGLLVNGLGVFVPLSEAVVSVCLSYGLLLGLSKGLSRLRGTEVLGTGDLKYIAALSAWVGKGIIVVIFIASVLLIVQVFIQRFFKQAEAMTAFAPSLTLAGLAVLFFGADDSFTVLQWLFGLGE